MSYNGIADRFGDLLPAMIPTQVLMNGKLIRMDYKLCFHKIISEHHKQKWESREINFVRENVREAINASHVEIRVAAYGKWPKVFMGTSIFGCL